MKIEVRNVDVCIRKREDPDMCKPLDELKEIVRNRKCKVNAIALNSSENEKLVSPSQEEIDRFFVRMGSARKFITLRQPRGRDILAACGQLAAQKGKAN